jgi:hypothetical protein
MTSYEAYQLLRALTQHFTTKSYDFIKYRGKTNCNPAAFDIRKDKHMYYRISKIPDLQGYIIANLLANNVKWVGDLVDNDAEACYVEYTKRIQSLTYVFRSEIAKLDSNFDANFKVVSGQHPVAFKLYNRKQISIETLIILNEILGFFDHWNKEIVDPVVWPGVYLKCMKYKPFMPSFDLPKLKAILRDNYT